MDYLLLCCFVNCLCGFALVMLMDFIHLDVEVQIYL